MARTALQKIYADFRQGFVTVANPLAYPEGSLKDIVNFDLQDNGTVRLRAGLRKETNDSVNTFNTITSVNSYALSVHIWDNVRNNGAEKIAVVQVGRSIHLFEMEQDGIDVGNRLAIIDLQIDSSTVSTPISVTSGAGWLFIAHPSILPKIIKRTGDTTFEKEDIVIQIRDLSVWKGRTEEETGLTESAKLYPQHEYNLRNGGWPEEAVVSNTEDPDAGTTNGVDPVDYTEEVLGFYPPINRPFAAGRAGGGSSVNEQNAYSPRVIENDYFGGTPIPVGHFIVNAHDWERRGDGSVNALLDPSNPFSFLLTKTYEWTANPSSIEFYAGRLWYAGAKGYKETTTAGFDDFVDEDSLDVSNTIYFSQQFDTDLTKVSACYQDNDPTGEDINQLLATDGGTLSIRGAGQIQDIKVFGTALLVFSSQGIWAVSGIDGNSFRADSFSVKKISNIGPSAKGTISATNNAVYYIANDALYAMVTDQVSGLPTPKDLTSERIKDFYTSIPSKEKERAKGLFDTSNRNFYMFYSDGNITDPDPDSVRNLHYNKVLIFNQDLGAFYKYDLNINSNYIVDGLFYNKDQVVNTEDPVVLDGVPVTLDGEPVALLDSYSTAALNSLQLLTVFEEDTFAHITFSSFTDVANFEDFGEDYEGFVEFGFDTAGDIMRDSKKAPVIISHMERTEDGFEEDTEGNLVLSNRSGCMMSYGWDWASTYKNPTQLYRFNRNYVPSGTEDPFNYGVDVITTRNRIRGKGYSLGIRLDSEAGKDCRVLGIGIMYTAARDV